MNRRNVSISLLLTLALGLTACGGGGDTPTLKESGDPAVDTTSPVFANAANIKTNHTIEEGTTSLVIAMLEATDDSVISFSLEGSDAAYFELDTTKNGSVYKTVLKFKDTPDYEVQSDYDVKVVAADTQGNESSKEFTIRLTDKPFVFDVTGNMGSVVFNESKTLSLSTKEAKDTVTYTLSGNSYFTLNNNSVDFNAPDFNTTIGADNSYTATVTASDDDSQISLNVSATVTLDPNTPAVKTYLLKSKREITDVNANTYTDYVYAYDANNTLVSVEKSGTNIIGTEKTTFSYSDDYKIMKGYSQSGDLQSIRIFEDKATIKNKFAASIIGSRLSVNQYEYYINQIADSVSFKHNRHLTTHIYGLDNYQTIAEAYQYNSDDTLRRDITGDFSISSNDIGSMSDNELHRLNGSSSLNVSQETQYNYSGGKLTSRKGINHADNKVETFPVTVSYYQDDVIKEIVSSGISISYDNDSRLNKVNNFDYGYVINGDLVTVTVKNTGKTVATYNFEEE